MRSAQTTLLALTLVSMAFAGCGDDEPTAPRREWRPSDHTHVSAPPPADSSPQPASAPPTEAMIARAAATLFGSRCVSCHGASGAGDGAAAPTASMPDLRTDAYQEGHTDADIARAIRMGQGLMPAFGGQLNDTGRSPSCPRRPQPPPCAL